MYDFLNQELKIGDYVVYMVPKYRELNVGKVLRFGKVQVTITQPNGETFIQNPSTLIRIDENDAIRVLFEKSLKN